MLFSCFVRLSSSVKKIWVSLCHPARSRPCLGVRLVCHLVKTRPHLVLPRSTTSSKAYTETRTVPYSMANETYTEMRTVPYRMTNEMSTSV